MIGNEVVFDDVAAFNAAMQSEVRQELRQHFREFPPFTGRNTHFPMNRTRHVRLTRSPQGCAATWLKDSARCPRAQLRGTLGNFKLQIIGRQTWGIP